MSTDTTVPVFPSYHVSVVSNEKGQPACSPETLTVSGQNVMIAFAIQLEGYEFPETGAISFSGATEQFPGSWRLSDTQLALVDYNGVQGSDEYTLYVRNKQTGVIVPIDPIIINEP